MYSVIVFVYFLHCLCLTSAIDGGILEIHYPDIIIETDTSGNITFQSGEKGSVLIRPGFGGTVFLGNTDILQLFNIIRSLPPVWDDHASVGFSGTFHGGDAVNIQLKAKDPDGGNLVYSLVAGNLPPGLTLDSYRGLIHGIAPNEHSLYIFTLRAIDNHGTFADAVFSMETKVVDMCKSSPCSGHGECIDNHLSYFCNCTGFYGGQKCDINCQTNSLGVTTSNKKISDAQMSAYLTKQAYFAKNGRIGGTGWCGENGNSWLQVDLGELKEVHTIEMKAIGSSYYTATYKVSYSRDGNTFVDYKDPGTINVKTFQGTTSTNSQILPEAVEARYVRIIPISYRSGSFPCMKIDLHGCDILF